MANTPGLRAELAGILHKQQTEGRLGAYPLRNGGPCCRMGGNPISHVKQVETASKAQQFGSSSGEQLGTNQQVGFDPLTSAKSSG